MKTDFDTSTGSTDIHDELLLDFVLHIRPLAWTTSHFESAPYEVGTVKGAFCMRLELHQALQNSQSFRAIASMAHQALRRAGIPLLAAWLPQGGMLGSAAAAFQSARGFAAQPQPVEEEVG
jgi:hypothetical protein